MWQGVWREVCPFARSSRADAVDVDQEGKASIESDREPTRHCCRVPHIVRPLCHRHAMAVDDESVAKELQAKCAASRGRPGRWRREQRAGASNRRRAGAFHAHGGVQAPFPPCACARRRFDQQAAEAKQHVRSTEVSDYELAKRLQARSAPCDSAGSYPAHSPPLPPLRSFPSCVHHAGGGGRGGAV